MFRNLAHLIRYRGLIQSLVARELKARYRGSVLGFFWSFINPLLLLLVYTFVFKVVLPEAHPKEIEPYALFLFCGLLPWTWFSSSLLESANVLIAGGNLIKKVLFPAEVLPIVTVLANLVHFCFGLPILAIFLVYFRMPLSAGELVACLAMDGAARDTLENARRKAYTAARSDATSTRALAEKAAARRPSSRASIPSSRSSTAASRRSPASPSPAGRDRRARAGAPT